MGKIVIVIALILLFCKQGVCAQNGWEGRRFDSGCIKHPDFDTLYGIRAFSEQLRLISLGLADQKGISLNRMISYEATLHSDESSLGHYWTVSNSIYPKVGRYRFGNPISFDRVECPVFSGHVDYFYTRQSKKIKVVLFTWNEFHYDKRDYFEQDSMTKVVKRKLFEQKFEYLVQAMDTQLGKSVSRVVDSGFVQIRWASQEGIDAFMFMFPIYNEINLSVYRR